MSRGVIGVGLLTLLVGCSDSGGSGEPRGSGGPNAQEPPPALPSAWAGHWYGTATDTKTGKVTTATAFIDSSGETQLIVFPFAPIIEFSDGEIPAAGSDQVLAPAEPYFVVQAKACCGNSFTGPANVRTLGGSTATSVQLQGSLNANALTGSFDYAGTSYAFDLEAQPDSQQPLTLQDAAGVYSNAIGALAEDGFQTVTESFVVANDGTVTGSSVLGCIYNGRIWIPDPGHDLFRIHLQIDNCSQTANPFVRDGEYDGLGILQTAVIQNGTATQQTILYYSLIGPVWLGTHGVIR